uniref:Xylulose kinase-1 n=1 Tax=Tanacetum cinerariifolium TaxID=118510 RepID=A0A699H3K9_TANCI|nr:hypothetical protein [Tanacetum cinerariifolium]
MAITFANTHNMITYLNKSDASEGFEQILDFLNASVIQYALTVNPTIYVSCIKQFWSSFSIKKTNDVVRLQALIDRRKVIIIEDTVHQAFHLDDAESIDCLPNEEIFVELARMGYEKPSTKLTFYKAFFSAQWKFLIHTILQFVISAQVGDLSSHTTKYTSLALTQKVFANIRRVGKGFYRVDTPLFEGMLVPRQAADDVTNVAADDVDDVAPTPPQSPIAQPSSPPLQQQPQQPSHDAEILMDLFNTLLETCTTLTKKAEALEQDKIAQALENTKLKQRVRRLEKKNKLKDESKHEEIIAKIDADEDVILEEVDAEKDAEVAEKDAAVQGRLEESQAHAYHIDLEHANKVLSIQDDELDPTELKEVIEVVTTAKLMTKVVTAAATTITAALSAARRRKGVVIRDPEETTTPSTIVDSEPKSKDKGKCILVEEPKPLKKLAHIEQDEAYARELKAELNKNINWDDVIEQVKRKKGRQCSFEIPSIEKETTNRIPGHEEYDDLEMLWKIVQERFASSKPKNFSNDFLLTTFKAMFEKPDVEAHIWKNQRGIHGLAKVKSWKLLESCGVHIITFNTTLMILLVERRYPLTRFILDQMLNNVRLEVEEESEVSLELLRFIRRQQQEGYRPDFGVDVVEDFKEYTLRDYYCWLKTYYCLYKLKLLDNAAASRLRLLEQSAAADDKMKK